MYILVPEEHLAEPMPGTFTREVFEAFIKEKFFKPDMSKIVVVKDKKDAFAEDGFVMFTKENCVRCDATLYSLAREAQLHGLTVKTITCSSEDMKGFCIEKGILRLPTTWIAIDGVPSDGNCYTGSDCMEEYNDQLQNHREERKTQEIPKQEPDEEPAPRADPVMITDTKTRVEELENKVAELEQQVKQLLKQHGIKTEL